MRHWIVLVAVAGLLAACQTTSGERTSQRNRELIDNIITVTTRVCISEFHVDEKTKRLLKDLDKTPPEICNCTMKKIFIDMSDADVERLIDDIEKNGSDRLGEREPWKRWILDATMACLAAPTMAALPPGHC